MNLRITLCALSLLAAAQAYGAGVLTYGDKDVLGTASYGSDPTSGATLNGLAPGTVTFASLVQAHSFPFSPSVGDFPGTDQIYVGSTQTGAHDGYSVSAQRINGPQILSLDYSSLVSPGDTIASLTLGIAADDFQNAVFGQPFTASINGTVDTALTAALNGLNQSGPVVQFFTIGIDPSLLAGDNLLWLKIDEGGDGGDGWAVDYLTVGVSTVEGVPGVPDSANTLALLGLGLAGLAVVRFRRLRA